MSVEANLARALELDDDYPDNTCPGCGQNITGWQRYDAHYPPGQKMSPSVMHTRASQARKTGRIPVPLPFVNENTHIKPCPWTCDYLTARQFRRAFIAKHWRVGHDAA